MKGDSVAWYTEWLNLLGNKMKRASRGAGSRTRRTDSNLKTMAPMFYQAMERIGKSRRVGEPSGRAVMPPVLSVRVKHLRRVK